MNCPAPQAGEGGPETARSSEASSHDAALRALLHRLNNQLGIVLAHAELLEAKAADAAIRDRAAHVVSGALEAMGTAREIGHLADTAGL